MVIIYIEVVPGRRGRERTLPATLISVVVYIVNVIHI